jgi:hypothetical protein
VDSLGVWGCAPSPATSFPWMLTLPHATSLDPTRFSPPPVIPAAFPRTMRLPDSLSTSRVASRAEMPPPREALLADTMCSPSMMSSTWGSGVRGSVNISPDAVGRIEPTPLTLNHLLPPETSSKFVRAMLLCIQEFVQSCDVRCST